MGRHSSRVGVADDILSSGHTNLVQNTLRKTLLYDSRPVYIKTLSFFYQLAAEITSYSSKRKASPRKKSTAYVSCSVKCA